MHTYWSETLSKLTLCVGSVLCPLNRYKIDYVLSVYHSIGVEIQYWH